MAGYTKNIAVIKGIKNGFSADGGALSGLVKTEKYGPFFRAEISYINFAPLSGGRYVAAVSDGAHTVILDGNTFEGESEIDTSFGFAALVCFVGAEVLPIATAVCGDFAWAAAACAGEIERAEKIKSAPPVTKYEDEAIAEENYYEYSAEHSADFKGQGAIRQDKEQKDGRGAGKDEDAGGLFKEPEDGPKGYEGPPAGKYIAGDQPDDAVSCAQPAEETAPKEKARRSGNGARTKGAGAGGALKRGATDGQKNYGGDLTPKSFMRTNLNSPQHGGAEESDDENQSAATEAAGPLFYERMGGEIEKLLSSCPREEALERTVENSRWVRVSYGKDMHYVFGVINEGSSPSYICYGVPGGERACPESLAGMAGFIPTADGTGYWVMYQDARTGSSVKLNGT